MCGDSDEAYYANQEDDFIFEDFARLRLKGYSSTDETEAWPQWSVSLAAGVVTSVSVVARPTKHRHSRAARSNSRDVMLLWPYDKGRIKTQSGLMLQQWRRVG